MAKLWKILKKVLLFTGLAVVVLSLLAGLLTWIYQDDIKAMAIKEVNKTLKTKIYIRKADISITFFSSFPDASIRFENFKIMEPGTQGNAVLAQAKLLALRFSPFDIINRQYHIKRIILQDGQVNIRYDKEGNPNYLIFKTDTAQTPSKEASPLDIKLNRIRLKNMVIHFSDEQNDVEAGIQANNIQFSGSFTDSQYRLGIDADLVADVLKFGKRQYLSHKALTIAAALDVDNPKHLYTISNFKLKIDRSAYSASGSLVLNPKNTVYDLNLKGQDASIQTIISLLPNSISTTLKDYHSAGQASFEGTIKGQGGGGSIPAINCRFNIANGSLKDDKHALGLEALNLKGEYSNGRGHDLRTSFVHINTLSARLNGRQLNAHFVLDDLSDPMADIALKSNLNLNDLRNFISIATIDSMNGDLNIDASFKGRFSDLKSYHTVNRTQLSGNMSLKNVALKPAGQRYAYKNLTGSFATNGNDLAIQDFSGQIGATDFTLNGQFKNLASFLFLPDQVLNANATLQSRLLRIDDFIASNGSGSPNNKASGAKHFDFPAFMAFNFSIRAERLTFGKFEAENISGATQFAGKTLLLKNISMSTMDGTLKLDGSIEDINPSQFRTVAHAVLKHIDVKKCFYECENFGQTFFTDKYIQGKIDAAVDFSANWGKNLDVDTKSIVAVADVTIYDGEIHKFPQFMALGKFLKVKSLDDISFSEYTNRIDIRDRKVSIPKMDIKSSAVNMSLAGTHTFDNVMDYHMKINMSQLLFGNRKSYEDEFGEIEVDENGGLNIFLTMTGPVSNYKIKYDTKSSLKSMGQNLSKETKDLGKLIHTSSPNAKPGEDLNGTHTDYEFQTQKPGDNSNPENSDESDDGIPPKKKTHTQDTARRKAFDNFRKKLNNLR